MLRGIEKLMQQLQDEAAKTGEVQKTFISSGGVQPIIKDGKVVGRFQFASLEMTVTSKKKTRKRKTKKGGNDGRQRTAKG